MTAFTATPHFPPRLSQGPLSRVALAYAALLCEQGYTEKSSEKHLFLLADLNQWLHRRHLQVTDLTERTVHRYLEYRHRRFRSLRDGKSILRKFLRMLEDEGLLEAKPPPSHDNPYQRVEDDYDRYLSEERGLAMVARVYYRRLVHRFLSARFSDKC